MRIPIIAGNWKMYKTIPEALDLVRGIKYSIPSPGEVAVVVAPSFTALSAVANECRESYIGVAAQNIHFADEGAFTGEVSGAFVKDIGCEWTLIGHSERRQYFGETDETVNKKIVSALKHGLLPIVCVGETLAERQAGETFNVISRQIGNGLPNFDSAQSRRLVIAYEPVWAIGTGRNATPEQAEEVHAFIRKFLAEMFGAEISEAIRILYGGSVKPENAREILNQPNVDGALVGGASLKVEDFVQIIRAVFTT